ncbi:MAG: 4-hydroxy-3-methylbut-2-enyl diphosphate reductase [Bacteroidales bacterium]|nr:4-hydroxy-3-methylbut-2-enyl diphosphate reductase [Bacteroidales bacterium]
MKIEIDNKSGFCFGVINAIQLAEMELDRNETLYCLGNIVHNNAEVERLKLNGLLTIDHDQFKTLKNCKVLLRAHGEPPETYEIAIKNNIQLIDASCPVVLKLQNNIKIGFDSIKKKGGQVLIYGKEGHAEVNGLVGQTNGRAIVIGGIEDLNKVDFSRPINLFSQTTKSIEGFYEIQNEIKTRMIAAQETDAIEFVVNDTICRQVSNRQSKLRDFVKKHDVIIFVSGQKSSNGKMLYQVCKEENPNTYFVSNVDELKAYWFKKTDSIGVCGATSTPRWLMKKIAENIEILSI